MKNIIYSASTILLMAITFTGCELLDPDSFMDSRDKKVYQMIKIGDQTWMAQNLAYIPTVGPSGVQSGVWVYGYEGSDVAIAKTTSNYLNYGCLFDWATVTSDGGNGRDICPEGWHLPTDAEWSVLTDYLGGEAVAGKKMKSVSGWNNDGNGENTSGFNGRPGGGRSLKYGFVTLNFYGVFQSSTSNTATTAWYRGLSYLEDKVNRNDPDKLDGYSVRCIKNQN